MKNGSYADQALAAKLMLAGLKAHGEMMGKGGLDAAYLAKLEGLFQEALAAYHEQQALKARLKEKTASVNNLFYAMEKVRNKAKKMIKIELDQESWQEFGISDSR